MPDNALQFTTKVDLSELNAASDQIKSKFDAVSGSVASAMDKASQATEKLADAQRQLGASAALGNETAAAIIQQYTQEVESANAVVKQLQSTQDTAASSAAALASTNNVLAASQENVARTASHQLTELQATSAITRELSGGASIRAVENFLSKTLGLGPVMQAIFPIAGAIAFGEIIFDVGEKIYKAFDLGGERARQLAQEIENVDNATRRNTDSINVQIDRLEQEQAKLEKRPFNGIKLTLDEAALAADNLATHLESAESKYKEIIAGMGGSTLQHVTGLAGTQQEQTMLEQHTKWIGLAKTTQDQLNESTSYAAVLQSRLNELKQKSSDNDAQARNAAEGGSAFFGKDYTSEIASVQQLIDWQKQEQAQIQATIALNKQQGETQKARDNAGAESGASAAARKELQDIEAAFADLHTKLPEEAAAFWQSYLSDFDEGSKASGAEYTRVVEQINHFNDQFEKGLKQSSKLAAELKKMTAQSGLSDTTAVTRAEKLGNNMSAQTAPDIMGQQHAANMGAIEQSHAVNQDALKNQLIPDPEQQLQELRTFHQQADQENIRFDNEQIKRYASVPQQAEKYQKQLEVDTQKSLLDMLRDTQSITDQMKMKWQEAFKGAQTSLNTMLSQTLSGQETWVQASSKLYESLSASFIKNSLKMLEQTVIAAAEGKAVQKTQILADAKTAASNAYTWASSFGGPIGGAIAAAAAFAGVMAFDAFEMGGIVNGPSGAPVPIIAHAGERVLSGSQTQKFEQMVNTSSGGGGSAAVHVNYNPTVNAYDRSGFSKTLQAHRSEIHDLVAQGVRSGAIKGRM